MRKFITYNYLFKEESDIRAFLARKGYTLPSFSAEELPDFYPLNDGSGVGVGMVEIDPHTGMRTLTLSPGSSLETELDKYLSSRESTQKPA